jgi:hypothetical protein
MPRNARAVAVVVLASVFVAVALVAVTNSHMQAATSSMFNGQTVTMLEDVSAEVAGKKLKNPADAKVAAKMEQMINMINGDFNSMMSYGSKVGFVAPATESIAAQARDGSLYKTPDIPDPPKFHIDAKGFILGLAPDSKSAAAHAAAHAAALSAPAPAHAHAELAAPAPAAAGSSSISAKEATLESELRKLKEQDLEAQLKKLQGGSAPAAETVHAAVVAADTPVKSAVNSDASYLLSKQPHAQVPHAAAPSDNAPDALSHPMQRVAASVSAPGSASGPYVKDGIKYLGPPPAPLPLPPPSVCFSHAPSLRYKNYHAYLLAQKMQALTAQISGDFDSMMSYGSKVGYVPPAGQESISAQVKDGSMFKSPDIADPPAWKPVLDSHSIANLASTASIITPDDAKSVAAAPSVPGLPSLPTLPGQGSPSDLVLHHLRSTGNSNDDATDKSDRAAAPASKGESEWQKKFGFLAKDEAAAAKADD